MELTLSVIINKLKDWREDIDCDIRNLDEKGEAIRQSVLISSAIGMLENVGQNNNIPA